MADDPKELQSLKEGGAVTLDWSTVSNIHGTQQLAAADNASLAAQLQGLADDGPVLLEWSTISNVHTAT